MQPITKNNCDFPTLRQSGCRTSTPRTARRGGTVRIVAAKDEYEPGSFLIYPLRDLGKTQLTLTPFKTGNARPELFDNEVLHMSDEGFVRWRRAVEPVFDAVCAK